RPSPGTAASPAAIISARRVVGYRRSPSTRSPRARRPGRSRVCVPERSHSTVTSPRRRLNDAAYLYAAVREGVHVRLGVVGDGLTTDEARARQRVLDSDTVLGSIGSRLPGPRSFAVEPGTPPALSPVERCTD